MKAYGTRPKDGGCCPGHDKQPWPGERTRNRKQKNRPAKRRARQQGKKACEVES